MTRLRTKRPSLLRMDDFRSPSVRRSPLRPRKAIDRQLLASKASASPAVRRSRRNALIKQLNAAAEVDEVEPVKPLHKSRARRGGDLFSPSQIARPVLKKIQANMIVEVHFHDALHWHDGCLLVILTAKVP